MPRTRRTEWPCWPALGWRPEPRDAGTVAGMASDFTYEGIQNHQCQFVERSSGTTFWLQAPSPEDAQVELLDGDEAIIPAGTQRDVWSIRERRVLRTERG